jgi:hypothetical protein
VSSTSDSLVAITQAIVDILNNAKVALGLEDVWYGDTELIPRYPAVAVESGPKARRWAGAPFRMDVEQLVYIIIYHCRIQDTQITKKDCDIVAELVETELHKFANRGLPTEDYPEGLVIQGWISNMDPGYATRSGVLYRATRMTWTGLSKVGLPTA